MATNLINTPAKRKALKIRREPYWLSFAKGRALGYRSTTKGGSWVIRQGRKQSKLGDEVDFTYDEALELAQQQTNQAKSLDDPKTGFTFDEVLQRYRDKKAAESGEHKANQTYNRLLKIISDDMLNAVACEIPKEHFEDWKNAMVLKISDPVEAKTPAGMDRIRASKATVNRYLATIKAALNYVFGLSFVGGWSNVTQFKKTNKARTLFLTEKEVQSWLDRSQGAFKNLSKAAVLTGCRLGELRGLTVRQFEQIEGVDVRYILDIHESKTGPRIQRLSSEAADFFKSIIKDKKPDDLLLPNNKGVAWRHAEQVYIIRELRATADIPLESVFYSLRHYHISKSLIAGFNVIALARNVGTSVKMLEEHYAKFMESDIYSMLDKTKL